MRTIHEILIEVKKAHLEDIKLSIKFNNDLFGLCWASTKTITSNERDIFLKFLKEKTNKDLSRFIWSTKNTDKSRLKWLDKHIELTKPK